MLEWPIWRPLVRCTHASWPRAPAPARNLSWSNGACTTLFVSHQVLTNLGLTDLVAYKGYTSLGFAPPTPATSTLSFTWPGGGWKQTGLDLPWVKGIRQSRRQSFPKADWTCWLTAGIMKLLGRNVSLNEYVQKAGYCSRTSGSWLFAGQHSGLVSPVVSL